MDIRILLVAGARPNFMKIAPLVHELGLCDGNIAWKLMHTGQHYDYEMSKVFFEELNIPEPSYFLNVGSGSHAEQTARVMLEFEKVCLKERPDAVVVVGDVNSTLACAITAKKLDIRVAHVESGLRSGDMSMPEEINRIVTDSISDYLFVSERSGIKNLEREGRRKEQIFFVGNIMIDALYYSLNKLKSERKSKPEFFKRWGAVHHEYAVATLHRPSNVDNNEKLRDILSAFTEISKDMPLYFPVHPRTMSNIEKFKLNSLLSDSGIIITPPLSYLDFLSMWKDSSLVFTDSGGIQEETTGLGVPCFTIRENTERPITVEEGTNTLVGTTKSGILRAYSLFKRGVRKKGRVPELWDGKAAMRIVKQLFEEEAQRHS